MAEKALLAMSLGHLVDGLGHYGLAAMLIYGLSGRYKIFRRGTPPLDETCPRPFAAPVQRVYVACAYFQNRILLQYRSDDRQRRYSLKQQH